MRAKLKDKIVRNMRIIGLHYEKYRLMMIIASSLVAAAALFFSIWWEFDPTTDGELIDNTYLAASLIFLGLSVLVIVFLILNKYRIIKTTALAVLIHIYTLLLVLWGTLVAVLDLSIGISPFIYIIVLTTIAGIFIVEPIFYAVLTTSSFAIIMLMEHLNRFVFFTNEYMVENIFNTFMFAVIIALTAFRHFNITIKEWTAQERLEKLSYIDELTGLLNERSYVNAVDGLNEHIKTGKAEKFAIVMMDLNNLKATNDAYGHRFGCHLVVECGHVLPTVFKTSKLFHVGGDEFIAIVMGPDLLHFDERMETFKKTLEFSYHEYDGVQLIFSVAHGESVHEEGEPYSATLQRADEAMYINKKWLKETHGMKGR